MQFSTKCWSEHILSAYKATKDLKHPLYMTFKTSEAQTCLGGDQDTQAMVS